MTSHSAPAKTARTARWGGVLVGAGAAMILVAIVLYLTSGAVPPAGASAAETADALTKAPGQVSLMAYLSVPANFALLVGAVLLAARPAVTASALLARAAWVTVAAASFLVVQFDLLLPHALIPLAERFDEAPVVFEAAYRASNYVHSVGLFFTFLAFLTVFAVEARARAPILPRAVAYVAVLMWATGLLVSGSLVLERPLVMLAPTILVGWSLVAAFGVRMAGASARAATAASDADRTGN